MMQDKRKTKEPNSPDGWKRSAAAYTYRILPKYQVIFVASINLTDRIFERLF